MILKTSYKMKPPISAKLFKGHPLAKGIVGLWLFNEGSGNIVQDLSGNGNNSPAFGGSVTWASGKYGSALDFTNAGAGVPINNSSLLKPGTGDMTWIIWLDMDSATGGDGFWADRPLGAFGTQEGVSFGAGGSGGLGTLTLGLEASDNTYKRYNKEPAYTVAEGWFQFAVTWNNSADKLLIYKNGIDITSSFAKINDDNLTGKSISNSTDFIIGARPGGSREIDGRIDHVTIYNRALSPGEVALLYREPFCMFDRPMDPLFSLVGAPPEIQAVFMDLSTQIWTIKHSKGIFTKL